MVALISSTLIALLWPESAPDGIQTKGMATDGRTPALAVYIWLWSLFWWFIQDAAKVRRLHPLINH